MSDTQTETIPAMRERHKRELRQAIEAQNAQRLTQTEAAKVLGVSLTCLNNLIRRNGIQWTVVKQGVRS